MAKHDLFGIDHPLRLQRAAIMVGRDRRIDFLRGLAVMAISANHIWPQSGAQAHYPYPAYKFGHVFAFDFADVFLLLSGIVAGIVFFPQLIQHGLRSCYARALRRTGQIWSVHVICVFAALPIILIFEQGLGVVGSLLSPFDRPMLAAFSGNLLLYKPSLFLNILPVYIMLLVMLPLGLMLFVRSVPIYFAVSGAVWSIAWVPVFLGGAGVIPPPGMLLETPYFIHPLSTQLVFFTGVAIGIRKREIEAFIARHCKAVLIGAGAFLLFTNYMAQVAWIVQHFDQKEFAGPLRLAELLAVMALIWSFAGPGFQNSMVDLIETCGRHSLPVFAITTLGAIFFTYLIHWLDAGRLVYGLCIMANVGLCLLSGHLLEKRRTAQHTPESLGRYQNLKRV